jgi:hypothetical protein
VLEELAEQVPEMTLPKDDEMIQAFASDRSDETFGVRVAVGAPRRYRDASHTGGLQKRRPCFREQRVAIVNEVARVSQDPSTGSSRLRATCFIHTPSGAMRTPAIRTARDFRCITKNTKVRIVPKRLKTSTAKKSRA